MFEPRPVSHVFTLAVYLLVLCFAIGAFYFSLISGFRLPENYSQLAWQLNFDRTAITFSAGFALAASLVSGRIQNSLANNIRIYIVVVLTAAGLVLGAALSWPKIICILLALGLGLIGFYLSGKLTFPSPANNLVLAPSLYVVFLISVVSYFTGLVFVDDLGGAALWLLADTSRVAVNGVASLCAVFSLTVWLLVAQQREMPSRLLLSLSIGLLGPIMFIAYLVPTLVKKLALSQTRHILVSGLLSGALLTLISTLNSLMLGGYAPALIIPLGFVSIPVLLWLSRAPQKRPWRSALDAVLIMLIVLLSIAVVWHLASFAERLA